MEERRSKRETFWTSTGNKTKYVNLGGPGFSLLVHLGQAKTCYSFDQITMRVSKEHRWQGENR